MSSKQLQTVTKRSHHFGLNHTKVLHPSLFPSLAEHLKAQVTVESGSLSSCKG